MKSMDHMIKYRERLREWNGTEKYRKELQFLYEKMQLRAGHSALDYGCGIGTAVEYMRAVSGANVIGYDKYNYFFDQDYPAWYRTEMFFQVDKVYFMHSIAHIQNISEEIEKLKYFLKDNGSIYVITPNAAWLSIVNDGENKTTDDTVLKHFEQDELFNLFSDAGFNKIEVVQFGDVVINQRERLWLTAQM